MQFRQVLTYCYIIVYNTRQNSSPTYSRLYEVFIRTTCLTNGRKPILCNKGIEKMKKNENKYSVLLTKVSPELVSAYNQNTGVDLQDANTQYKLNEQVVGFVMKVIMFALPAFIIIPVPLALVIIKSGLITSSIHAFWTSCIGDGLVMVAVTIWCQVVGLKAAKKRNAAEEILTKFRTLVESFQSQLWFKDTEKRPVLDSNAVYHDLVSRARQVLKDESLLEYLRTSRCNDVRDICAGSDAVKLARKELDMALERQTQFGLSFTKKEVHAEAEKPERK